MSAPAFTPGPWQFVGYDEVEQANPPHRSICQILLNGDESEANANLIAAAPELAEQLEWMLLRARRRYGSGEKAEGFYQAEYAKPLAALAKARGES